MELSLFSGTYSTDTRLIVQHVTKIEAWEIENSLRKVQIDVNCSYKSETRIILFLNESI